MTKYIILPLFLAATAFAKDPPPQLAIGAKSPDFKLVNTVDDKFVNISRYEGKSKAVCVIFSCNHCPVAKAYEDRMIALGNEFGKQGVQLILISSNDTSFAPDDGPAHMKARALEKKYPFPYLYDPTQWVGTAFGARVTPHVFLFDGNLTLRYRGAIDDSKDQTLVKEHYLSDAIKALVAGKPDQIVTAETVAKGCSIKWKE